MKTGKLIDRFVTVDGGFRITAQLENGDIKTINVSQSDAAEAQQISGGGTVRFERSGSAWRYVNDAEFYGDDQ